MSGMFALRAMASQWRTRPPYPQWAPYANELWNYAEHRIADPNHQLPVGVAFSEWLKASVPVLARDPYRREDNTIIARRMLPLFERDQESWLAIRYLNCWSTLESVSFENYFQRVAVGRASSASRGDRADRTMLFRSRIANRRIGA
jgi:hypothetical protein